MERFGCMTRPLTFAAIPVGLPKWNFFLQRVCWWIMLLAPTVFLAVLGYLGVVCPNWWIYLVSTSILGWIAKKFIL